MAITFTPLSGDAITIGGTETASGDNGGIGPFPRYSISREDSVTGDGSYVGSKYTINITGTAVLSSSPTFSSTGARQNVVQQEAGKKLAFNLHQSEFQGAGLLEIAPYGGLANKIKFPDARIVSVELPEQNEESAGVQYLEYSFVFEAYSQTGTAGGTSAEQEYQISEATETWDISENEGVIGYENDAVDGTPLKTYTITHTVTATGRKKISSGAVATNGEAWAQAKGWVKSRLGETYADGAPNQPINKNTTGTDAVTNFDPRAMGDASDKIIDLLTKSYKAYNKVRQINSDVAGGSYSVTDNFLFSPNEQKATHEIEVSVESSTEAPANVVSVNGTIQGLDSNTDSEKNTIDKYDNALAALDTVLGKAYGVANDAYSSSGLTGSLRTLQLNKTVGHNKSGGIITWSVSFDDLEVSNPDYLSEETTITYNNPNQNEDVFASFGIVGLEGGPLLQDMQTTNVTKVSISVDIVVKKEARGNKPDGRNATVAYIPNPPVFIESETETWNPYTGAYNYSVVYTQSLNMSGGQDPGTPGGEDPPEPPVGSDDIVAVLVSVFYAKNILGTWEQTLTDLYPNPFNADTVNARYRYYRLINCRNQNIKSSDLIRGYLPIDPSTPFDGEKQQFCGRVLNKYTAQNLEDKKATTPYSTGPDVSAILSGYDNLRVEFNYPNDDYGGGIIEVYGRSGGQLCQDDVDPPGPPPTL